VLLPCKKKRQENSLKEFNAVWNKARKNPTSLFNATKTLIKQDPNKKLNIKYEAKLLRL